MRPAKTMPAVGQWWRFEKQEGRITKIYPGGGGGMGIAEFHDNIPAAHVCIMLKLDCYQPIPAPTGAALPPPCTCVDLGGGVMLSDGCAAHDATHAVAAKATAKPKERRAMRS